MSSVLSISSRVIHVIVATTVIAATAMAQMTLRFDYLTVNDGLSQGSINAIEQDALGFMWFGTNDGLTRYDGHTLRPLLPDPIDTFAVHDHVVTSLLSQGAHTLWVGMRQGGVRRVDLRTLEVRQVPLDSVPKQFRSHQIVQLLADHRGEVWALSTDGLFRYDSVAGRFDLLAFAAFEPGWVGTGIAEDRSGVIWVSIYNGGLFRIPHERGSWQSIRLDAPVVPAAERLRLRRIVVDARNTLWIGSDNVLVGNADGDRDPSTGAIRPTSFEPFASPHTLFQEGGRIWFTSGYQMMSIVDPVSGFVAGLQHDPQVPGSISPGNMISGAVDRGGVVWLGSSGYGVNRLANAYRRFTTLLVHAPLSFRSIRTILVDRRGFLWVGGYPYEASAGLDRIDRTTGTVRTFTLGQGRWQLPNATVWSIVEDPDRASASLWVGCGNTLTRVHGGTGQQELTVRVPNGGGIRGMRFDQTKRLWVGTQRGLFRLDPDARSIRPAVIDTIASDRLAANILATAEILQITELSSTPGRLWCATSAGLLCYDPASGSVVLFRQGLRPDGLRTSNVQSVLPDGRGGAWVSTGGAGFARMTLTKDLATRMPDERDLSFRFYSSSDGLANDFVYGVLAGNDDAVWASTNRGLARLDLRTERFRQYDVSDGLQDNEFNAGAFFRASDGELFFGGVVGVNHFYPNRLQDNPNIPSVVITECRLWGESERRLVDVPFVGEIEAKAEDHTITFEFVGLEYTAPERNRYRYQLEGFNQAWVESGTNRTATYTNLEPGTYTFRVTASNNDGVWNPTGAAVRLVVHPPFWKTVWFRGSVLLIVAGLWIAGIWYRGRRMAAQNRELEERVRERTAEWEAANSELEAFTYTVSHDLRAPVRAINGYSRMLMEEHASHLPKDAQRMLAVIAARTKRMGDMIDDLLTFSRTGRQALVHATIDMNELVRGVASELLPTDGRVALTVEDLPPVMGDNALLRQVWINLIANAVKFSSGAEHPSIAIGGRNDARSVVYWVSDNGVGFDMAYQHKLFGVFERLHSQEEFEGTGVGLAIVARVIKRHGGRVWAESRPGHGATFSFELPLVPPASA